MSDATDKWYLSGPLGIGTPSPEGPLHIKDSTEGTPRPSLLIERKVSPRIGLVDTEKGSVDAAPAWFIDNFSDRFRIFRQPNIGTGGAEFFTVLNNGNVGVGSVNPQGPLHVKDPTEGTPPASLLIERKVSPRIGLVDTKEKPVDEAPVWFIDNFSDRFRIFRQPNIGTGGAEFFTVVNDGKVGIGTPEPNARLSVVGSGATEIVGTAQSAIFRTSAGSLGTSQGSELSLGSIGFHSGNNTSLGIRAHRFTDGSDWTTAAIGLGIDVDNTVRVNDTSLWLHPNGRVGISTSNPLAKFHVNGDSLINGNVGIGVTNPQARLDVSGDVIIQGSIAVAGKPLSFFTNWGGLRTQDVQADGSIWCKNEIYAKDAKVIKSDIAENYFSCMELGPGDVVSIMGEKGTIVGSEKPNDVLVLGVISTEPGLVLNAQRDTKEGMYPVALSGRVPCKVVVENGPINYGDLLTSSSTLGHAMKAKPITINGEVFYRPGTIIGKALGSLESAAGIIDIFVFSS